MCVRGIWVVLLWIGWIIIVVVGCILCSSFMMPLVWVNPLPSFYGLYGFT
jgi:hypothetical protein